MFGKKLFGMGDIVKWNKYEIDLFYRLLFWLFFENKGILIKFFFLFFDDDVLIFLFMCYFLVRERNNLVLN